MEWRYSTGLHCDCSLGEINTSIYPCWVQKHRGGDQKLRENTEKMQGIWSLMWQPVWLRTHHFHNKISIQWPPWMTLPEWSPLNDPLNHTLMDDPILNDPFRWPRWKLQMFCTLYGQVFVHVGFVENSVPTCSFAKMVKVSARTWWKRGKIPFCCVTEPALFVVKYKENLWMKVIHWKWKGNQGSYIFCCVIRCQCHVMNLSSQ